ncbi:MAG: pyruvate ferredoxin oxidoreductase [Dehalococcoidia bacterium]|nr:pyruvate ferredoxin oxidoreductase [Dehalococcoidia bacterium]
MSGAHADGADAIRRDDLVIRFAGEAGEGIKSPGELIIQAAARAGYRIITDFSPPAEIKGGVSFFQIRLSTKPIYTRGDAPDVLLAFNQEAYDAYITELRDGGMLIFDPDRVAIDGGQAGSLQTLAFPMGSIASSELKMPIVKNVVAVGGLATLFGLETDHLKDVIRKLWRRKGEAVVETNHRALDAGIAYVNEHVTGSAPFALEHTPETRNTVHVSGNQATSLGALAGGVEFFAGYPITPASDVMEYLAAWLPQQGGHVVQAEDEIAAINMLLGASYAGARAMTTTSGPGFSLMVEALGLATMAEIPAVIVDAQRVGPSTGMPTRHEQADLNLTALGGHGEVPRIVLAATSVEDCFWLALEAFNLSEKYQSPVILMTDTVVAVRTESIERPDLSKVKLAERATWPAHGTNGQATEPTSMPEELDESGYLPYEITDSGVSPMSLPGTPGGQYVAMGLEHNEKGRGRWDQETHTLMTQKRFRKVERAVAEAPAPVRYGEPTADIGIVTWGSTAGTAIEAMDRLARAGVQTDLLVPRMVHPLPHQQLADFMAQKRIVIVPEVNYVGQFANLLLAQFPRQIHRVNVYGGQPMRVEFLVDQVKDIIAATRDGAPEAEAPARAEETQRV